MPEVADGDRVDGREGHLVLDDSGQVLSASRTAERLLASGDLDSGAVVTDVVPEVESLVGASEHTRTEVVREAGRDHRYLSFRTIPLGTLPEAAATLLVVRETTSEQRIEPQYRELVESTAELCLVLDADGTVTFVSSSVEWDLDTDHDELVGSAVTSAVHPDDHETVRTALDRLLADPESSRQFEFRVWAGDGEWRVLEGIGHNRLETGAIRGIVVTARDITDRKAHERELERQNERLEQFANVVSHDLRNPLQVAKAHIERAEITGDEPSYRDIREAHERMETIIEDVLTLARQGQRVAETTPIELAAVARDAWATVDTEDMTMRVEGSRQLAADRDRLKQLFENLFRNAVEHAGTDATVTVSPIEPMHTTTRANGGARCGFYVADDGPGIPEDKRDEVLDSGFTTTTTGTGFGLAIVAGIADAHRWETTVTESRDGGARFEFTEQVGDPYRPKSATRR